MLNYRKTINLICVFLVLSVLCASVLLTAIALISPQEDSMPQDGGGARPGGGGGYNSGWGSGSMMPGGDFPIEIEDLEGLVNLDGLIGLSGLLNAGKLNMTVYKIKSTESGFLYLRIKSFGDYNGKEWGEAQKYNIEVVDGFSAIYLPSLVYDSFALENPASISIQPMINQYIVPYYVTTQNTPSNSAQKDDVQSLGDASKEYTLGFTPSNKVDSITIDGNVVIEEERNYRDFVKDNYLEIDDITLKYMYKIIEENGFISSDPDIIDKVASYIQNAAQYDLEYDRELDNEENIAIAFLEKYKTGICQHYATAATLLFRALGIPARYTVGFAAPTITDQWVDVTSKQAHAWVEVYINGIGWKYVEVTGGGIGGDIGDSDGDDIDFPIKPIDIYPIKVEQLYDGVTTLYAENKVKGFEKYEELGLTYKAVVSGERLEPGKSKSRIEEFTVYDPLGNDITDKFEFNFLEGDMHVYLKAVTAQTISESKVYDGALLTAPRYMVNGLSKDDNITYDIKVAGNRVDVGISYNIFEITLYDSTGTDVTDNYKINKIFGELEIMPKEITITAKNAEKKYDGTPLICSDYEISKNSSLAPGDTITECKINGSQTEIGRSECTIDLSSIKIVNQSGQDVTGNYSINILPGKLRVTP